MISLTFAMLHVPWVARVTNCLLNERESSDPS